MAQSPCAVTTRSDRHQADAGTTGPIGGLSLRIKFDLVKSKTGVGSRRVPTRPMTAVHGGRSPRSRPRGRVSQPLTRPVPKGHRRSPQSCDPWSRARPGGAGEGHAYPEPLGPARDGGHGDNQFRPHVLQREPEEQPFTSAAPRTPGAPAVWVGRGRGRVPGGGATRLGVGPAAPQCQTPGGPRAA